MEEDWDLHAVVRGCTTITSSSTTTTTTSSMSSSSAFGTCYQPSTSSSSSSCSFLSIFPTEQAGAQVLSHSNSNPFEATSSIEELHDLCKPFFLKPTLHTSSSFSYSSPKSPLTPQKQQLHLDNKQPHLCGSAAATTTPRSKRRKNQLKKVCEVEAENLSADIWAWRKYGQKPIKGSPYPRGYYRCSSSKGCLARKQVERKKSDPTMFIVTYTGEHSHPAPTHRNSLAGSTRQKPLTPQTITAEEDSTKPLTKPASPATTSEAEEEEVTLKSEDLDDLMNDDEEENDQFGLSDMVVTDDFFEGLDDLTGFDATTKTGGDSLADPFAASVALPACGGQ